MLIARGVKCGTVTGESVSMYGHLLLASAAGAVVLLWPTQLQQQQQHSTAPLTARTSKNNNKTLYVHNHTIAGTSGTAVKLLNDLQQCISVP